MHKSSTIILPDHISPIDLANTFGHFFSDKIAKIRVALKSSVPISLTRPNSNSTALSCFEPVSEGDILKILKSSTTKSCDLDPIPCNRTSQRVCGHFGHSNNQYYKLYSLREGSFPNCFKTAYVTPLLKKPNLDRNLLKNYRPVSNLSFISKLMEKVVAKQLNNYIDSEGLSNVNQSAYRRLHSTESALLKIQNDIAASMDSGKAVALTLLDLSAAFDTIDHDILFNSLGDWFGVDSNSNSNSTFIALNLHQKTDSKAHHTKTLFNIQKPETLQGSAPRRKQKGDWKFRVGMLFQRGMTSTLT